MDPKDLPPRQDIFPFEYVGGGYFRRKGVPKGTPAEILHGEQAIAYLLDVIEQIRRA